MVESPAGERVQTFTGYEERKCNEIIDPVRTGESVDCPDRNRRSQPDLKSEQESCDEDKSIHELDVRNINHRKVRT